MLRIRPVLDSHTASNRRALEAVQDIMSARIADTAPKVVQGLPQMLTDPISRSFTSILYVAEDGRRRVKGFALLLHASDLNFCFLDMIATAGGRLGRGTGGALYERVRQEAALRRSDGLWFECLTDDPAFAGDDQLLRENRARLRFYEQYGARPIDHTRYEEPLHSRDLSPLYLMWDSLGTQMPPARKRAKAVVRAILTRKYSHIMGRAQIDGIVRSFRDDPITLRAPRYGGERNRESVAKARSPQIILTVSDKHVLHQVHDRAYVEAPVRLRSILPAIEGTGLFHRVKTERHAERYITDIHDKKFVDYLKLASKNVPEGESIFPEVFPVRNQTRAPKRMPIRSGYFCIDTFTPLYEGAYVAARDAVDCTLTAADALIYGDALAYALVRPPGHHAERAAYGGYCYFNNAAIAAHYLSEYGRIAVLDLDYHHGNGTQQIFYERDDVLTASVHADPYWAYPYFSGFSDETGEGVGKGYNLNYPLPEKISVNRYLETLNKALSRIRRFKPVYLIVGLGLDTAANDPTGSWPLVSGDYVKIGAAVAKLGLSTLVVQEGGYRTRTLGTNARSFFQGLTGTAGTSSAKVHRGKRGGRHGNA